MLEYDFFLCAKEWKVSALEYANPSSRRFTFEGAVIENDDVDVSSGEEEEEEEGDDEEDDDESGSEEDDGQHVYVRV